MVCMPLSLRRFLACLLLVALPWQGVAAAAMVLCQPATQALHQTEGAHAGHAAHHGHEADAAAASSGHVAHHAADASSGGTGLQADADHHCNACSLCGHALALPGTALSVFAPSMPQGPVAGALLRADSRVAPLPDKPPRA